MSVPDPGQLPLNMSGGGRRIPLAFTLDDVRKLKSESHAIEFSVRCSGYDPKEIPIALEIDAGQWSCILSGSKHFPHSRRNEFMDLVGNEILLMYACESRGYNFDTLRPHQSNLERENAELRAQLAQVEHDREVERSTMQLLLVGRSK